MDDINVIDKHTVNVEYSDEYSKYTDTTNC